MKAVLSYHHVRKNTKNSLLDTDYMLAIPILVNLLTTIRSDQMVSDSCIALLIEEYTTFMACRPIYMKESFNPVSWHFCLPLCSEDVAFIFVGCMESVWILFTMSTKRNWWKTFSYCFWSVKTILCELYHVSFSGLWEFSFKADFSSFLLKYPKMCLFLCFQAIFCVFSTISALFLNSHSHLCFLCQKRLCVNAQDIGSVEALFAA